MVDRVILHSDINCCYASIEHLHHPELAGKPLAVGGDPEARHGIVLTADYIAKKYGVKTGMALWQAKQVCPDITFVSPRMDLYLRFSRMAHEIYAEYTDRQEPYGIDECWLDVTGSSCVTSGALELGVGQELYHMEKGDIGFVFPDVIHHYQVLTLGVNKATYLIASPFTIVKFADIMQSMAPEYPIIKAEKVEPEVYRVINAILETEQSDITVAQAYLQIVLARCIGKLNLVEKSSVGSNDLIYQTVSYISANFKKKFSLEEMAKDLGVSKYVLSRLFSKTFHRNFNQYLNDARLNYACHRLENTSDSITNICLDSGFESQRTFNRVFKERYKISPSDYRSTCVKEMLS